MKDMHYCPPEDVPSLFGYRGGVVHRSPLGMSQRQEREFTQPKREYIIAPCWVSQLRLHDKKFDFFSSMKKILKREIKHLLRYKTPAKQN